MSSNGQTSPGNSNGDLKSPRNSLSLAQSPTVAGPRLSLDSERNALGSPPIGGPNGTLNGLRHNDDADTEGLDPFQKLERELERTNEEKEQLATQYRNLLAKLTTMRNTLGNKLKQDAV